ncbi:hypothetical protein TNIN_66691 [Trichonephila inaurata madagascariensis]|uniref:Uncharacterized protein n=1 Tax=Trichonephila inaurata madagascariensis TaxID=2747483 RepID=A0A8X6X155_9ARAC|nr:hypothetical protein TNIN_66691 [Trichonephila inaurata madagascariensis]
MACFQDSSHNLSFLGIKNKVSIFLANLGSRDMFCLPHRRTYESKVLQITGRYWIVAQQGNDQARKRHFLFFVSFLRERDWRDINKIGRERDLPDRLSVRTALDNTFSEQQRSEKIGWMRATKSEMSIKRTLKIDHHALLIRTKLISKNGLHKYNIYTDNADGLFE